LKEEKVAMVQKLRELEWGKDQEIKSLNKALARVKDDGDKMKISSIQDIEKIKDDVSDRYKEELKAKNHEMSRMENIYAERIDGLQKEVNKLHIQLD
jgi:uncharacterized protein YpuA (DUF1002 family)